jgi:hypothetical protein
MFLLSFMVTAYRDSAASINFVVPSFYRPYFGADLVGLDFRREKFLRVHGEELVGVADVFF